MDGTGTASGREGREPHEWGEAVEQSPASPLEPGDIATAPAPLGIPEPVVGRDESTPLEDDEPEGTVPPCPLWAMKDRRHIQWHLLPAHERHERVRDCVGTGDEAVYVIDDGSRHVMLGRRVGAHRGECDYCLVARVPRERYQELKDRTVAPSAAFDGAREITLCGVAQAEDIISSNVFDVAHYADAGQIPPEYLPGAPFIELDRAMEITAD